MAPAIMAEYGMLHTCTALHCLCQALVLAIGYLQHSAVGRRQTDRHLAKEVRAAFTMLRGLSNGENAKEASIDTYEGLVLFPGTS